MLGPALQLTLITPHPLAIMVRTNLGQEYILLCRVVSELPVSACAFELLTGFLVLTALQISGHAPAVHRISLGGEGKGGGTNEPQQLCGLGDKEKMTVSVHCASVKW